ncbi:MAG TPA: succinate--CoA ligase subunit alpha [Patescibacteria group bacterium]|nr:succinate--CoA ligase subunit alpha [Patescibacteria group bacterium]
MHTACLVQGITGQEGKKAAAWMRAAGTKVLAGVTPGKGGQLVDDVPVFNSVKEAVRAFPSINTSTVYAPARFAKDAVIEAVNAGILLVHLIAENVPVRDAAELIAAAHVRNATVLGPSSIGIISPGKGKIGSIGGETNTQFSPGPIGVISKSGGMSSEIALLLTRSGIGQSTVVGIGGDRLIGTSFADLLPLFEHDAETKAVVMIGEIGGTYEEEAADVLLQKKFTKPLIAFISGAFAETLPQGVSFGHAGAIVDKDIGTLRGKIEALQKAGAIILKSPDELPQKIRELGI